MQKHATLDTVKKGNWLVKASAFDDQILIFFCDLRTMESHVEMFYCENKAYTYVELLTATWIMSYIMQTRIVKLINPFNKEIWFCDNYSEHHSVDGVDYIKVYKPELPSRSYLMRKDALQKSVTPLSR